MADLTASAALRRGRFAGLALSAPALAIVVAFFIIPLGISFALAFRAKDGSFTLEHFAKSFDLYTTDLLFSLANLARRLDIEPESALREANDKFTRRFDQLEAWLAARDRSVHGTPLTELEEAWQAVKALPSTATPATSARMPTARTRSGRRSRSPQRRRDRS